MHIKKEYYHRLLASKREGRSSSFEQRSLSKWTYLKQKIFVKDTYDKSEIRGGMLGTNFKIIHFEIAPNILEPRFEFHATEDPSWGSRMGKKIMFYRPSSRQWFLRYVESFEKKRGTDYDG